MARKKQTRKELLKSDDAFVAAASQGAQWVASHRTLVIAGSVALAAIVLGTWGAVEYLQTTKATASAIFSEAQALLDAPVTDPESADPDAAEPSFASEEDKLSAALTIFEKLQREVGTTGAGSFVGFYIGDIRLKLGETADARRAFEQLLGSMSSSDSLLFAAVERTAFLQEQEGDDAAAIRTWSRLAGKDDAFWADTAVLQLARLYAKTGDADRAKNLLESFPARFAESTLREKASERLAQLGGAAQAPVE